MLVIRLEYDIYIILTFAYFLICLILVKQTARGNLHVIIFLRSTNTATSTLIDSCLQGTQDLTSWYMHQCQLRNLYQEADSTDNTK